MISWIMLTLCLFSLVACGSDKSKSQNGSGTQNETRLGLGAQPECGRAKEIHGSNSMFQWTKAEVGNLQKIVISTATKTIDYSEARADSYLEDTSPYRYIENEKNFYFKTLTKSLKLSFPSRPLASISGDESKKEYVVSILSYDDGSGLRAYFLCPKI
ncbi:MAG: hypothetical protein H0V66_16055 [Bdellovibrionales bacterium]|nr:hypothetical protein [Bdellovibrionales bacterium]